MATTSTLKTAVQGAKGTAESTGFICGIYTEIGAGIEPERSGEDTFEYSCAGSGGRPTAQAAIPSLVGYTTTHSYSAFLYPDMIGNWLVGAGFDVSTATDTPVAGANTHTFTIADEGSAKWLTLLRTIGTSDIDHRYTDTRVSQYEISDSRTEVTQTISGTGIKEDDAAGTETSSDETNVKILQRVASGDGILATVGGTTIIETDPALVRPYQDATFTIENPLVPEDGIYQLEKADLNQSGIRVYHTLNGVEIDNTLYNLIHRGGAAGTAISEDVATGAVTKKLESSGYITGTTPYSITITMPTVFWTIDGIPTASGGENIRVNLRAEMYEGGSEPCTIVLVNGVTSYT